MLDGTYLGLQASVAEFLGRPDLYATIPDFILLAEAQLNRKLRVRAMVANVTTSVSNQLETFPTDFAGSISISNTNGEPLDEYTPDALNLLTWKNNSLTGTPTAYAVINNTFQLYPLPAAATTLTMTYFAKIPPLASNPAGNWLLASHPDAYLYGALTQTAPYLREDDRVAVWGEAYAMAIKAIQRADNERWGERLSPQPTATQII